MENKGNILILIKVFPFFEPTLLIIEFFFTFISVILCFLIFSKTREMYELTKHEGIYYHYLDLLIYPQIAFLSIMKNYSQKSS